MILIEYVTLRLVAHLLRTGYTKYPVLRAWLLVVDQKSHVEVRWHMELCASASAGSTASASCADPPTHPPAGKSAATGTDASSDSKASVGVRQCLTANGDASSSR